MYIVVYLIGARPPPAILCFSAEFPPQLHHNLSQGGAGRRKDEKYKTMSRREFKTRGGNGESTMLEIHFFQLPDEVSADIRKN